MKRLFWIVNLIILPLCPFWQIANAQQVTDLTQQAQAQAATAPAPVAPAPAVSAAVAAPAIKSPFDFSGYFKLYPVGFDDGDNYIGITPGASLATKFNALGDKQMSVNFAYELGYRAFYTTDEHTADDMDFDNQFTITASIDPIDKLSIAGKLFGEVANQANDTSGNFIWVQAEPKVTYKAIPTTSLSLAYSFVIQDLTETSLAPGAIDSGAGPGSEPGDLGTPFSAASASGSGAFGAFAFTPSAAAPDPAFNHEKFIYWHELNTGVSHKFSAATTGTLNYIFGRFISNDDNSETYENKFKTGISQEAWKGAKLSFNYELRVFDFIYALGDDAITPRRNYRNRLVLELEQAINKWFTIEAHYRYQKTYSNFAAAELDPGQRQQLWLGVALSF
jgi:hypothetical protein